MVGFTPEVAGETMTASGLKAVFVLTTRHVAEVPNAKVTDCESGLAQ
jgi:hypothetical protein